MTLNARHYIFIFVIAVAATVFMQASAQDHPPASQPAKQASNAPATQQKESEGDRIFQQNCARCHRPPDGFSPRISGTIVRHMRVRASLSKHDEDELLRFLNP